MQAHHHSDLPCPAGSEGSDAAAAAARRASRDGGDVAAELASSSVWLSVTVEADPLGGTSRAEDLSDWRIIVARRRWAVDNQLPPARLPARLGAPQGASSEGSAPWCSDNPCSSGIGCKPGVGACSVRGAADFPVMQRPAAFQEEDVGCGTCPGPSTMQS